MASPNALRQVFDQVVDRLGADLVAGRFERDVLPVEADLAAELGIGRSLLREAMKVLSSKGLVSVRPGSGTRLQPREQWNLLDADVLDWVGRSTQGLRHAFEIVELRLVVEPPASRLAALRATLAERQAIAAACSALEACVGAQEAIAERDVAFHRAVLRASHNPLLGSLATLLGHAVQAQVRRTTDHPGAFERGLPLHRAVARAIDDGDAAAAEQAARRLVLMPYEDLAGRLRLAEGKRLAAGKRLRRTQAARH